MYTVPVYIVYILSNQRVIKSDENKLNKTFQKLFDHISLHYIKLFTIMSLSDAPLAINSPRSASAKWKRVGLQLTKWK